MKKRQIKTPKKTAQTAGANIRNALNQGFTLIELMVVIAVIAILLGAAVPAIRTFTTANAPQYATDELYGEIQLCRLRAARNNQRCQINFNLAAGTYSFTDFGNNGAVILPNPFKVVDLSKYRGGVTLTNSPNPIDPVPYTQLEFLPQGILNTTNTLPAISNSVYLTNQDNTVFYRILVSVAGGTSVDRWNVSTNSWQ